MNTKPLNVLVFTTSFPSVVQPEFGVHVKERLRVLSKSTNINLRIVAPAPYFPKIKFFRRWYAWSQVPNDEIVDGLTVHRPRYVMLPKIGGLIHDRLIYRASLKYIENLQREFDFDLIDSHFAYPSGSAAIMLGQRFCKPVVITCRGADIAVYPNQSVIGDRVRYALRNAGQLVALSHEMRSRMIALGADDGRITTIPNGVDLAKFDAIERSQARTKLGLPQDCPIILSVGYRLELKGFHILVDALAEIRKTHPKAMVAIVGGQARWAPDYLPEISQRIQEHGLQEHVVLAGTRPQEELKYWNSAADLCCILSSREGSPNVMMEALACGTPLISTRVGNVPEILQNPTLGSIIEARTAQTAGRSLCEALSRTWNRETIRSFAMTHSWTQVASQVEQVFQKAVTKKRSTDEKKTVKQVFMQKNAMSAATICTEEMPVPACSSRSILVANCYSMISPGTESTAVGSSKRDMVVKALTDKDIRQSVVDMVVQDGIRKTVDRVQYEMTKWTPLGYSGAGIAIEVGSQVTGIRVGDLVAHAGQGHAEIIRAAKNLCVPVPDGVSASEAAPVALGSIALQAVRRSDVGVGDTVALIGLGLVGQLTGQLLQSAGARVFATDLLDSRISIAKRCGLTGAMRGGENATQLVMDATGGMGVDCVVICAGTNPALLQLACKLSRERGRIVIVGGGSLDVPRHDFYMKELDLVISRSYGPGRYDARYEENGVDYPYAYVRWTEQRNMAEFVRLVQAGKVNIKPLITHEFNLDQAPDGYRLLMDKPDECMGILLKYPESTGQSVRRSLELRPASPLKTTGEVVGLGVIGCGAFARQFHLPNIKASARFDLRTLVASTAQSAKEFGLLYSAQRCATDAAEVWNDSHIDATMLFTRDTSHASLACKALTAGKHVFCEKPLAVNREECMKLLEASASSDRLCMTGFNRRFAPLMQQVKSIVATKQGPKQIYYRVNAGSLPHTSWILDPVQSAGRVIGEACHFIDLFRWLVGEEPTRVTAVTTGVHKADHEIQDVNAIFEFPNHSTATLLYSSLGTSKFPKERLELFTGGLAIAMDDFREFVCKGGVTQEVKHRRIDKGHYAELEHFADAIQGKIEPLITIDDGVQATICCLAVLESIRTGKSIEIERLSSAFGTQETRKPL